MPDCPAGRSQATCTMQFKAAVGDTGIMVQDTPTVSAADILCASQLLPYRSSLFSKKAD